MKIALYDFRLQQGSFDSDLFLGLTRLLCKELLLLCLDGSRAHAVWLDLKDWFIEAFSQDFVDSSITIRWCHRSLRKHISWHPNSYVLVEVTCGFDTNFESWLRGIVEIGLPQVFIWFVLCSEVYSFRRFLKLIVLGLFLKNLIYRLSSDWGWRYS